MDIGSTRYMADLGAPTSVAIPLDFAGPQVRYFGGPPASRSTVELGNFVGDTSRGGSCNVERLSLVPQCNGTHTESVGHVVDELVPVQEALQDPWLLASLVSVEPVRADSTNEAYRPALRPTDRVITAASLSKARFGSGSRALVIRTLPNSREKISAEYGPERRAPFLTNDAMRLVVAAGIEHLLLDVPSVDRADDDGLLTNHRLFWNLAPGSHELSGRVHRQKTITEMVFVPHELADGRYLLTIQVPPFLTDAAPSRPLLFPLTRQLKR